MERNKQYMNYLYVRYGVREMVGTKLSAYIKKYSHSKGLNISTSGPSTTGFIRVYYIKKSDIKHLKTHLRDHKSNIIERMVENNINPNEFIIILKDLI